MEVKYLFFAGSIGVLSLPRAYTIKYKPCFPQYPCPPPSVTLLPPSLPCVFFSFKRAKSIKKATSLFCHLRVCCTSISFPSSRTRFRGGQFPLLSISLPFIYLFRYFYLFNYVLFKKKKKKKPPTQKPPPDKSLQYFTARCPGKIFLFFQFSFFVSSSQLHGQENTIFLPFGLHLYIFLSELFFSALTFLAVLVVWPNYCQLKGLGGDGGAQ